MSNDIICARCGCDDTLPVYHFLPAGVAVLRAPAATVRTEDGTYVPQPSRFCPRCSLEFPSEPARRELDEAFYVPDHG